MALIGQLPHPACAAGLRPTGRPGTAASGPRFPPKTGERNPQRSCPGVAVPIARAFYPGHDSSSPWGATHERRRHPVSFPEYLHAHPKNRSRPLPLHRRPRPRLLRVAWGRRGALPTRHRGPPRGVGRRSPASHAQETASGLYVDRRSGRLHCRRLDGASGCWRSPTGSGRPLPTPARR